MGIPNYEECSLPELLDVERNIDKEKYPERYQLVLEQIELKRERGEAEYDSLFEPDADKISSSPYYKYQTFWRRFWALNIDGLLFFPLSLLHVWLILIQIRGLPLFLWFLTTSAAHVLYFILMHAAFGQTIGKMITRVIVLDVHGSKLSYRQAVLRDIVPLIVWPLNIHWAYLMAYGGVSEMDLTEIRTYQVVTYSWGAWAILELVTMLLNKKRRALHDFIAGSVVVKKLNEPLNPETSDAGAG